MSNSQFSKANVPVADLPKKSRTIASQTLFTNNFFNLTPVYRKPVYVGDSITVKGQKFSRTLPMPYPAFSTINDIYRAFFVPYTSIFKGSVDFFENSSHMYADGIQAQIQNCPYTTYDELYTALTNSVIAEVSTSSIYDFIKDGANFRFTERGAQIYKVLLGLGYEITGTHTSLSDRINLLPLMAYLRIFFDWYWPKNYVPTATYAAVLGYLNRDLSSVQYYFDAKEVTDMLLCVGYSFYDDRAFVDCWDNPSGPNDPTISSDSFSFNDPDVAQANQVVYDVNTSDSAYLRVSGGKLTKWALNTLNSLSDFLKRNQLAGSGALQRFLARHGVGLKLSGNRSILLGEDYIPVQVSDVSATNENATINLGDLSGKGVSKGQMQFGLQNADNRGIFLVLCSSLPDGEMFQGIDKYNLCTTALEFYQPEFYNNGVGAVSAAEVYMNPRSNFADTSQLGKTIFSKVFGFLPQWYQYNLIRNMVLGDFRLPSRGSDILNAAHTFREFSDFYWLDLDHVVHSLAFQYGIDADQYQRITYLKDADSDFIQTYIKWITEYNSSIPMAQDTYSFDSDAQHDHGSVSIDTGGVDKS